MMSIDMGNDKTTAPGQALVKKKLNAEEMDEVFHSLRKQMIEGTLVAELDAYLGQTKYAPEGRNSGNSRNGKNRKTLKEEEGTFDISVPHDQNGSFQPGLIKPGQTRSGIIDEQIIALYAKGMTAREFPEMIKQL